jgi:hypothetical protein
MLLKENPEAAREMLLAAKAAQEAAHPRAEGLHVSDLIYCLRKAWYRRNGYPEPERSVEDEAILLMGQGHHGLLQCQGEYERPVVINFVAESVHGTVDLVLPDGMPVEIKTTRYSSNKSLMDLPHYVEQLASYAVALELRDGRLAIWHLNGDYRDNRQPVLRVWDLSLNPVECLMWLDELERRADAVMADWEPGIEDHYPWECKSCPFLLTNGGPCPGGGGRMGGFFVNEGLPAWVGR